MSENQKKVNFQIRTICVTIKNLIILEKHTFT